MKFLVLCILLGAPLALAGKRQYTVDSNPFPPNWPEEVPRYQEESSYKCHEVCDDDTTPVQASRNRRDINANIIEIREAPAKAIAIGLPPPLLNFGEERILRDESNEERPIAEQNSTNYTRGAPMVEQ